MLVIEDAHDMDAASAALLGAVLDALPDAAVARRHDAARRARRVRRGPGPGRTCCTWRRWRRADALALAER